MGVGSSKKGHGARSTVDSAEEALLFAGPAVHWSGIRVGIRETEALSGGILETGAGAGAGEGGGQHVGPCPCA